jgi:hypothetical protein
MLQKIRRTVAQDEAYTGPHANVMQTLAFIQAHRNINIKTTERGENMYSSLIYQESPELLIREASSFIQIQYSLYKMKSFVPYNMTR